MQELVAYYQHNSLGSSFPGVDTTLRCPYRDMIEGGGSVRTRSASATPAPLVPSPRTMGRANSPTSTNSSQPSERWAEVLFAFTAEYPDELTIDVRNKFTALIKCVHDLILFLYSSSEI